VFPKDTLPLPNVPTGEVGVYEGDVDEYEGDVGVYDGDVGGEGACGALLPKEPPIGAELFTKENPVVDDE